MLSSDENADAPSLGPLSRLGGFISRNVRNVTAMITVWCAFLVVYFSIWLTLEFISGDVTPESMIESILFISVFSTFTTSEKTAKSLHKWTENLLILIILLFIIFLTWVVSGFILGDFGVQMASINQYVDHWPIWIAMALGVAISVTEAPPPLEWKSGKRIVAFAVTLLPLVAIDVLFDILGSTILVSSDLLSYAVYSYYIIIAFILVGWVSVIRNDFAEEYLSLFKSIISSFLVMTSWPTGGSDPPGYKKLKRMARNDIEFWEFTTEGAAADIGSGFAHLPLRRGIHCQEKALVGFEEGSLDDTLTNLWLVSCYRFMWNIFNMILVFILLPFYIVTIVGALLQTYTHIFLRRRWTVPSSEEMVLLDEWASALDEEPPWIRSAIESGKSADLMTAEKQRLLDETSTQPEEDIELVTGMDLIVKLLGIEDPRISLEGTTDEGDDEPTYIPTRGRSDSDLRYHLGMSCMNYIEHKKWNDGEVKQIEKERAKHPDAKMNFWMVVPVRLPPNKPNGYVKGVVDEIRVALSKLSPAGKGGTTDYHTTGTWISEDEDLVTEPSYVINSTIPMEGWQQHAQKIRLIITNTQRELQQQCMAYRFEHRDLETSSLVPEDEVNDYPDSKLFGEPDPDILNERREESPSKSEASINVGHVENLTLFNIHSERQQTESQMISEDPPSSAEEPKPDAEWLSINLERAIKQIDDDEVQEALVDLQEGFAKSAQVSSHQFIHMVLIARCHELLEESEELKLAYREVRSISAHLLPDDTVEQVVDLIRLWEDPTLIADEAAFIEHWTTKPDPGLDFKGSQLISKGERNLFIGRKLLRQPVYFNIDNRREKALKALRLARKHGSPRFSGFADVTIHDDDLEGGPHPEKLKNLKDLATNERYPRIMRNDALTAWFAAEFSVDVERGLELFEQYHGHMERTRPQRRLQFYNNHLHHMSISQSRGSHQQESEFRRLLDRILSKTDDEFKSSPLTEEHRFLIVTMMECAFVLDSAEHIERVSPLVDRLELEFDTLGSHMKVELICIRGERAHRSGEKGVAEDCWKEMDRMWKRGVGTSTIDENLETEQRIERFKDRIGMEEE